MTAVLCTGTIGCDGRKRWEGRDQAGRETKKISPMKDFRREILKLNA